MQETEEIRKRRVALGVSQEQLCAVAGLSRTHYSEVEAGRKPLTQKMKRKVMDALTFLSQETDKKKTISTVTAGRDATVAVGHGATATNGGDAAALIEQLIAKVDALAADHSDIKALLIKLAAR